MKPLGLILSLAVLIASLVPASAEAASCQFVLGFKTLHDMIPSTVGDCKVDQHYNSLNGDALQETTGGMLVWRKSDNFTAFTDGYRSWVNGPNGLQQRLNTERFDWESDFRPTIPTAPKKCPASNKDLSDIKISSQRDGSSLWQGQVRNPCDYPLNAIVDVWAMATEDGPYVLDGPSAYVVDLAPGASQAVSTRIPSSSAAPWFRWVFSNISWQADPELLCRSLDPGCVDPWLFSADITLSGMKAFDRLKLVALVNGVTIKRGTTNIGVLGTYDRTTKTVIVDSRLDSYSSWVRAAVLAHEIQHAEAHASGRWPNTPEACYQAEEEAFRTQAQVWYELWGGRLPPDVDSVHAELNDITRSVSRDPVGFATSLIPLYSKECK